jgi:anti-sigma B factor antagonist
VGSLAHDYNPSRTTPVQVVPQPCRSQSRLLVATQGSPLVRVVEVVGEIDLLTAPELAECIAAGLASGAPSIVVVDLRQVSSLASAGLSVLVAADHEARMRHISLRLVVTTHPVRRVLIVTGLDHTLAVYPALEPALAACGRSSTPDGEVDRRVGS